MNTKLLIASGLILAGAAGFMFGTTKSPSLVSADDDTSYSYRHGMRGEGRDAMLQDKADILGMSLEDLKSKLETMTLYEVFQEAGIDQETLHEQMQQKAQARWQEMGLSDEEIQERLDRMEEHHENCGEGMMGAAYRTGFKRGYRQGSN